MRGGADENGAARDIKRDEHSHVAPTASREKEKEKEKENEKEKEKENKREKERERAIERKREQKAGRDRRIEVKAYYTARRAPGIPDFQVRSQVSRGARSAADHFDLRPHQSSPNHTPLISARHESRRTFSRNGQGRAYSLPPSSCSPLLPLLPSSRAPPTQRFLRRLPYTHDFP